MLKGANIEGEDEEEERIQELEGLFCFVLDWCTVVFLKLALLTSSYTL